MHGVGAAPILDGKIHWTFYGNDWRDPKEGFKFGCHVGHLKHLNDRDAEMRLENILTKSNIDWIFRQPNGWFFDAAKYRLFVPDEKASSLEGLDWLTGVVKLIPEIERSLDRNGKPQTRVQFRIFKEDYLLNQAMKIFLSHKGADKDKVRPFFKILKSMGFDPWLDEDAMSAGAELHRSIRQGFKDSCASVFFVTPKFVDEQFLRTEVNYAVTEKNNKGARFAIITLVLGDASGQKGNVPELLHEYVWKEPQGDLEALDEILKALPIQPGIPAWRPGV